MAWVSLCRRIWLSHCSVHAEEKVGISAKCKLDIALENQMYDMHADLMLGLSVEIKSI